MSLLRPLALLLLVGCCSPALAQPLPPPPVAAPLPPPRSLLGPDGSIPNTFESVNAFHMNDFTLSNLKHVLWVPRNCVILWCQVYGDITMKLLDAIRSSGPDRHRRIGTAARWYLGMPQIFLNDKGNYVDNQTIIERRLTQFLAGDFAGVLTEWRKAKDRARRRAKPPKQDTHPRRVTQCIKLFFKGYVSRGLRVLTGHGRANPEDPSIINQMKKKHPRETCAAHQCLLLQ